MASRSVSVTAARTSSRFDPIVVLIALSFAVLVVLVTLQASNPLRARSDAPSALTSLEEPRNPFTSHSQGESARAR
ncbi:MAG: hypothetical protein HY682_11010 [Chloroflexi bacterium]|nr:hypothetical protein [Chloroflexota bacterium]